MLELMDENEDHVDIDESGQFVAEKFYVKETCFISFMDHVMNGSTHIEDNMNVSLIF